jgi:hypothetical protein
LRQLPGNRDNQDENDPPGQSIAGNGKQLLAVQATEIGPFCGNCHIAFLAFT